MSSFLPECRETYAIIVRLMFIGTWATLLLSLALITAKSIYFKAKRRKYSSRLSLKMILTILGISLVILIGIVAIEQRSKETTCFGISCAWNLTDKNCIPLQSDFPHESVILK